MIEVEKMKKCFFLIICVFIIIYGCTNSAKPDDSNHFKLTNSGGLDKFESIESYQEYLHFLETDGKKYKCVEDMIKYESIKRIGLFKLFLASMTQLQTENLSMYYYALEDQSGFEFSLTVTDWSRSTLRKQESKRLGEELKLTDMRRIDETRNGYYLVDGFIKYVYVENGKLLYIQWDYNGLEFTLSDKFFDYPYGYDTFVSRMLDANQAGEAVRELMKDIYG